MANPQAEPGRTLLLELDGVDIQLAASRLHWVYNSKFPHGPNLGDLWPGVGSNILASSGLGISWKWLSAGFIPLLTYSQNLAFPLMVPIYASATPFANPGHRTIDFPQRMGDSHLSGFSLGDSFVRLQAGAFSAGLSTEPVWLGVGKDSSLMLSTNAPGMPHLDIGFSPLPTRMGTMEARFFWGLLDRSIVYQETGTRKEWHPIPSEKRLLTGMVLGYSPPFMPGFTVGLQRLFYSYWGTNPGPRQLLAPVADLFFRRFWYTDDNPTGEDYMDQLVSAYFRYHFPESGFEFWFEYGRNDSAESFRDLIGSPEHSMAFITGFRHRLYEDQSWRLVATVELADLGRHQTRLIRAEPSWYAHHVIWEGATNKGQIQGAWIGPGSNSQYARLDLYGPNMRIGLLGRRVGWDVDTFYEIWGKQKFTFLFYDSRLHLGVDADYSYRFLRLGAKVEYIHNWNRYYLNPELVTGISGNVHDTANWHLQLYTAVSL
jgi:hypothetical protein